MKVAYLSPLTPKQTGISNYSESLLKYLKNVCDIDIWVDGYTPTRPFIEKTFTTIDYLQSPKMVDNLSGYDSILYNIGNNPYYHMEIYNTFLRYNGVVILHEFILYYLITGYYLLKNKNKTLFLEEMKYNFGEKGFNAGIQILKGDLHPLQYNSPENYPLNKRLIERAKGIIVHSNYTKELVKEINPNANCLRINQVAHIPNMKYLNKISEIALDIKQKYGIKENELVLASFGFVAPTKRIHKVIEALTKIKNKNFKYLLVGEGDYVKELVQKYNLMDQVIFTGYISLMEFDALVYSSDIIINLRYPYMGETSASIVRSLTYGKPTIVSDIGWFSELPNNVVIKIPIGEKEDEELLKQLQILINDREKREKIGIEAVSYALEQFNGNKISKQIIDFCSRC